MEMTKQEVTSVTPPPPHKGKIIAINKNKSTGLELRICQMVLIEQ